MMEYRKRRTILLQSVRLNLLKIRCRVRKPHVKKEMNYDYEVPPDKMFFDIDKPSRNYYDLP